MSPLDNVRYDLSQRSSELIIRKGLPKTHLFGEIQDDPSNRNFFYFSHQLAELFQLDFIHLATIWFYESHRGIKTILDKIPKDHEGYTKAMVHYNRIVLATSFRPKFPSNESVESFLEDFSQGAYLKVGPRYFTEGAVTKEKYPKTFRCSEISGLSFEKLGIIRHALGQKGLHKFYSSLPKQDTYEKCIALLS